MGHYAIKVYVVYISYMEYTETNSVSEKKHGIM